MSRRRILGGCLNMYSAAHGVFLSFPLSFPFPFFLEQDRICILGGSNRQDSESLWYRLLVTHSVRFARYLFRDCSKSVNGQKVTNNMK
jgi:hypothetical protein